MIDGGGPFTSTSTGTNSHSNSHSNNFHAHNLIRSILFRHTSGPTSGAKTASSSGQSSATATTTTSRTANSSLEASPNHPLYAADIVGNININGSGKMKVTPQVGTASTAASGGRGTSQNHGGNRKNFPKFPSLLLGNHQGGSHNPPHHRHQGGGPTLNVSNANPSAVVRYAVPRRSGVLGRYHRTVGGLSASGHRRGARQRQQQQQQEVEGLRARAADQAKEGGGAGAPAEVVRHAQIHPRPSAQAQGRAQVQDQGQTQGQAAGNTGNANDNTTPQANLVANLRRATHITTDRPPYTNVVPQPPPPTTTTTTTPLESTLHRSSSSAAIPIPSHHIQRTASELQLCEDEMRAAYRDRVMYVRCYPAIAGATTARRMTMQATAAHTSPVQYHQYHQQQYTQGPYNQEHQEPTNQEEAGWRIDAYRRSTAPPVLSHGSGDADWLLYDDHPLDGSSPSACGAAASGAAINPSTAAAVEVPPDRSANPRPSYADEVEVEVKVEPSPSSSPIIVQNPTPPKDVVKATKGAATTEKGAGGWPVACSQTRRNISILRQASETMYSTTTSTATATTAANTATTGTTTTPSSSNPASRATSRTTSREEGDFNPYYHEGADHGQMILDGDGYLEGELHDYENPGPMQPRSAGGRATGRKNSASSYEDVFVIDDL